MMDDSARWQRLQELFAQGCALPAAQHAAFVALACADDDALAVELKRLLAQDADAQTDPQAADPAQQALADAAARWSGQARRALIGQRLGPWRVVAHHADGGMGAVYRGERADGRYEQAVAIKLLNPALLTEGGRQRLLQERQILARLAHPHIARLLDGGDTDDGVPYLVMEFVDGLPIDAWCRARRSTVADRLRLMVKVCRAVDHAHRNLVVHRDLKPSNLLIDTLGEPRLLDFGIAKISDAPADVTASGQRPLTPSHASPEQLTGGAITTATDVYALGVLLYDLLTGRLPHADSLGNAAALARAIVETEPPRPSRAVTSGTAEQALHDRGSRLTPQRLARELAGDLDNIVLMALRKQPERRYASAAELADDIERHLANLPVHARPDTFGYRAAKFLRRHPVAVPVSALAAATALAAGAFFTLRLADERDRATQAAAQADQVTQFMAGVFEVADPTHNLGRKVTARELLDNGARQIDLQLGAEPAVAAAMRDAMGVAYGNLGFFEESRALHAQAYEARLAQFGPASDETLRSLTELGAALKDLGRFDEAVEQLERAVAQLRSARPARPLALARALRELGSAQREVSRDFALAERNFAASVEAARAAGAAGDAERAKSMLGLGQLLVLLGRFPEARPWLQQALDLRQRQFGQAHPETISSLRALGVLALQESRHADAIRLFEQALPLARSVFGDEHMMTAYLLSNLGTTLSNVGRPIEGEPPLREALAVFRKRLGDDHPHTAFMTENLAESLFGQARYDEAMAMYESGIARVRAAFGERHQEYGKSLHNIAGVLFRLERYAEAASSFRRSAEVLRESLGAGHHLVVASLTGRGSALAARREFDAAEAVFREAQVECDVKLEATHQQRVNLLNARGWLALERGRPRDAELLFRASLAAASAVDSAGGRRIADEQAGLGATLTALQRYAEAEPLLKACHETYLKLLGERHEDTRAARRRLTALYRAWGRPG
jgi:serine/threonine-protein kinase